jgi:hypothetical protein
MKKKTFALFKKKLISLVSRLFTEKVKKNDVQSFYQSVLNNNIDLTKKEE